MKKQKLEFWVLTAIAICFAAAPYALAQSDAPAVPELPKKNERQRAETRSESRGTRQNILLIAGSQSTFDLTFDPCMSGGNYEECIRVANKSLMNVQYAKDKRQLIFTPLKKGETTVVIRDEAGDIRLILKAVVSESNLTGRVQELKTLLRDIEGIDIKIIADKIVVDGEVVVVGDLNRLYSVLSDSAYKDITMNLVTVSPVGLQLLANKIQQEINNPAVKVRVLNGMFVLEGQVDSADQKAAAGETAKNMIQGFTVPTFAMQVPNNPVDVRRAQIKDPVVNRITVAPAKPNPPEKMVRITIDFVELSKDYLRNFGFSWMPSFDASGGSISFGPSTTGGLTTQNNGSLSGTISNLFPKLNTAQNAGYARVLEESVLIVKQDKTASLQRNLKVPVETQAVSNGVVTKSFQEVDIGPQITVTPRVQEENIDMEIDFTYNGFAGRTQDRPIVLAHNYKTQLIIKNNESAAIVNAISNTISTSFNKDPPGGTPNSPLFTLLRSKAFQKNKSQFVVFMTPQLIESTSQGTGDIKDRYGYKRKQ